MDEKSKSPQGLAEQSLRIGQLLSAQIAALPDRSLTQRRKIYDQACLSMGQRVSRQKAAGLPVDPDVVRQLLERAIALAEADYAAATAGLDVKDPSLEAAATTVPCATAAHGLRPASAALIASVIALLFVPIQRLSPGLSRDEPFGGGDAETSSSLSYAENEGGRRASPHSATDAASGRPGYALPANAKDDRLPPSLPPEIAKRKNEPIGSPHGDGQAPAPSTASAKPTPPHVDQIEISTTFDQRFETAQPTVPSERDATAAASPSADEVPEVWSDAGENARVATTQTATRMPADAADRLASRPVPPAGTSPIASRSEADEPELEPVGNTDDAAVGSITGEATVPSRDDGTASGRRQTDHRQLGATEGQGERLSAAWVDSRHPTTLWRSQSLDSIGTSARERMPDEPLPAFRETIVISANASPKRGIVWGTMPQQFPGKTGVETIVQASVWLDGRKLATVFMRRNEDTIVPASHIIELVFEADGRIDGNKVTAIGPASLRDWPDSRGEELAAFPFEISPDHFVMTLSPNLESEKQNVELLLHRPWIGIPLTLANGTSRLLVLQKGEGGMRAIQTALAE